jgi:hypothetical protein
MLLVLLVALPMHWEKKIEVGYYSCKCTVIESLLVFNPLYRFMAILRISMQFFIQTLRIGSRSQVTYELCISQINFLVKIIISWVRIWAKIVRIHNTGLWVDNTVFFSRVWVKLMRQTFTIPVPDLFTEAVVSVLHTKPHYSLYLKGQSHEICTIVFWTIR